MRSASRGWTGAPQPRRRRRSTRVKCGPSPAGNDSDVDPDRRRELTRFGAPVAFLAAVTIAVLLIKAGLNHGSGSAAPTARPPTTTAAAPTQAPTTTKHGLTRTSPS